MYGSAVRRRMASADDAWQYTELVGPNSDPMEDSFLLQPRKFLTMELSMISASQLLRAHICCIYEDGKHCGIGCTFTVQRNQNSIATKWAVISMVRLFGFGTAAVLPANEPTTSIPYFHITSGHLHPPQSSRQRRRLQ